MLMRKIYVSDSGNDKDDGLTEKNTNPFLAAVHSTM
jgi:hypothetical protein